MIVDPAVAAALPEQIAKWVHNPNGFAYWAYPWGEGELVESTGPRKWQEELLVDMREHLSNTATRFTPYQCAISSGHGIGKGGNKSLVINVPSGNARWGDIKPGDLVFGADGRPTTVLATHELGVREVYRITFDDGSSTLCTEDHLWNVRGRQERRKGLPGWRALSTEQIIEVGVKRRNGIEVGVKRRNGTALARQWEIPIQSPAQFEEREIDLHPYLVGLWLGDGSKGQPCYSKPYPELAERVRNLGYQVTETLDGITKRISGQAHLFHSGVFLCGSHERYIPDDYKFNGVENRRELLRGLLDTDGEVNISGSIGYSSTSRRLIDDVIWLVRSLGGKAQLQPSVKKAWYPAEDGRRVECRDCYRATIQIDWNPFTIEHRKKAYKPCERRYLVRWIDSIEYSHDEDSMCITVAAPDGLYLANDFIVTHNSALLGFIIQWGMATCPDCKVIVTAGTGTQLDTKTVPEVTKWFNLSIIRDWFDAKATSITIKLPDHERLWRTDFITWSENNPQAFAGAHNKGNRIIVIFDEASTISDKIWETTEGALTDEGTEILWFACSQPTVNTGRFKECFGSLKHRWKTYQIDSRTIEGINQEQIKKWIEDYGEDSDFVRVRVRGEFPRAGSNQFIPSDLVAVARKYRAVGYEALPRIGSLDVARFGDNRTVLGERQGRKFRLLKKWRGLDIVQVAQRVMEYMDSDKPDVMVIDGDGIGGGVVDYLKHRGYVQGVIEFHGGQEPLDPQMYYNKRAECWGHMRDWLKEGAEIPDDPELATDLTSPEYDTARGKVRNGSIILESKEDMKKRGLASPDCGDCAAMSFGVTVRPKPKRVEVRSMPPTSWS